jgi:hypothetical protein
VAVDAVTVADPDRMRDALLMDDAEAQRMPSEEPEERCTPARRALLAAAGRSESPAWQATPQQRAALTTSVVPTRQTAGTAASRLAAASPDPAIVDGSASPARTASAIADRGEPARIRNTLPRAPEAAANRSRSPTTRSAAVASKRAPAATVASHAPEVEMPARTVRAATPSRPSGASAVRVASGANAADIVARVRSQVDRTLSALPGGTFRLR